MNRLSTEKRAQIIGCLVEGNSIRATVRMTGAAKNTITKLLVDVGTAASNYQDTVLRDLPCKTIQANEIWSFVGKKAKNVRDDEKGQEVGDAWTWVAIDADSKLAVNWLVGQRDWRDCWTFIEGVRERVNGCIQLSTDGHASYRGAVGLVFEGDVDWATIAKQYRSERLGEARYSPPVCTGVKKTTRLGGPDMDKVSTSYVERQNLTMRMGMRRFTRLTNAFSKRVENLAHAVSLHFLYYNFARPHSALRGRYPRTPAMAAGVADHIWSLEEIAALLG
jgi:IS1 family transposase